MRSLRQDRPAKARQISRGGLSPQYSDESGMRQNNQRELKKRRSEDNWIFSNGFPDQRKILFLVSKQGVDQREEKDWIIIFAARGNSAEHH